MPSPIQLARYDNRWFNPGGGPVRRALWFFLGQPLLGLAILPSSAFRTRLLRAFGARIGSGVTIKPSVQIKYPWHLSVGNDVWIGEHVWIDNLTAVRIGSDVCVSQGAYLCTGNHDWTDPHFGLLLAPIELHDGSWAGAKCILAPGTTLGRGAIAAAGSVVSGTVPAMEIYAGNPARFVKRRVIRPASSAAAEKPRTPVQAPLQTPVEAPVQTPVQAAIQAHKAHT